jgi:hypothetical protein
MQAESGGLHPEEPQMSWRRRWSRMTVAWRSADLFGRYLASGNIFPESLIYGTFSLLDDHLYAIILSWLYWQQFTVPSRWDLWGV